MPSQGAYDNGTYRQNQPYMNQQNYTCVDEDSFANNRGLIEVSEDDQPF